MSGVNKILSTSLALGMVQWFKDNFFYNDVDGTKKYYINPLNMYNGAYIVNSGANLPSLAIWTSKDGTKNDTWHEIGTLHIDITFGTFNQGAKLSNQFNEILSAIRAQLLTNPVYIMDYLQDYAPGILQLVTTTETDMSKYREALLKQDSSYVHSFELTYKINIFLNQKAVWADGNDYFSPKEVIYQPNSEIDTTVQIL